MCLGEQARVKPGPALPPHRPGGRQRGTEGQLPLRSSTVRICASATYSPSHQDDSKFLLKEETEQQHECTELKKHKQTVPWPRAGIPVTTVSGARRRQWSSITPSCYTLRQKRTARIADDAQQSGPGNTWPPAQDITVSHCDCLAFGWAGTVKPANRGAMEEGSWVFATKPGTIDSNPPSGPGEQEKPTPWLRQRRSDCHHHEQSEQDTSVQERKRSPDANPSYDLTTRKRRLESQDQDRGDSKAPSASIASSTCRKAGARGKHTRNVVNNTGERKRGREESRKGTR